MEDLGYDDSHLFLTIHPEFTMNLFGERNERLDRWLDFLFDLKTLVNNKYSKCPQCPLRSVIYYERYPDRLILQLLQFQ